MHLQWNSHAYSFNLLARFALHTTTLTYKVGNNKKIKQTQLLAPVFVALHRKLFVPFDSGA